MSHGYNVRYRMPDGEEKFFVLWSYGEKDLADVAREAVELLRGVYGDGVELVSVSPLEVSAWL